MWFDGLAARPIGTAEIDDIFESVAKPLVAAVRDRDAAALDALAPSLHRIGGSNAQRSIVALTAEACGLSASQLVDLALAPLAHAFEPRHALSELRANFEREAVKCLASFKWQNRA